MEPTEVVIRRRAELVATVALTSAALATAYGWRFAQTGSGVALLVGVMLGVVAVGHAIACWDARTPLLVADGTGLRIRLGSVWTGVPWSAVDRIDIDERGRLTDGHVAVVVPAGSAALTGLNARSRLAATVNRQLYDDPLVVPFGLATSVSVVDVTDFLRRLADGRTEVAVVGADDIAAEPSVEVASAASNAQLEAGLATPPPDAASASWPTGSTLASAVSLAPAIAPTLGAADGDRTSGPLTGSTLAPAASLASVTAPTAGAADGDRTSGFSTGSTLAPAASLATAPVPLTESRPRRRLFAARVISPSPSAQPVAAPLVPNPARRVEVTMPARSQHSTLGGLALSEPVEAQNADDLPEISALRRQADPRLDLDLGFDRGNVSLIIDATTDLSARAMQKVRRPPPVSATRGSLPESATTNPGVAAGATKVGAVVGGRLTDARHRLGMTVDELAERTRIRPYVIERIEVDDFSPCGGDFYARGHLRMLARVLGVDPVPLVAAYDEEYAVSPVNAREVFEVELATGTTGLVRGGERGANWGAMAATVLVLIMIWGVARYFSEGFGSSPQPPQQAVNTNTLGSPDAGNTLVTPPREAHVKISAVGGSTAVVVKDRFKRVVFDGMLADGQSKKFVGEAPLRLAAVDGGLISLSVQGKPLGLMGEPGLEAHEQIRALPDR